MPLLRRRRPSVTKEELESWSERAAVLKSTDVQALLQEYIEFPNYRDDACCNSVWRFVPSLLPPFLYRRRWIEYILFCGPTLKNSLLEELSMHIVIEALLVTIIIQPLFNTVLDTDRLTHAVMYSLLYFSTILQLVCISVHILAVISIAAIDESLMLEWVADKIEGFTTAGNLHTRSYFSFLLCIVAWPLLTISGEDPYYIKWVCLSIFCTFVGLSTLPWGAVGIINYVLHPQLQILHTPNDVELREKVERNVLLLSRGLQLHLAPDKTEVAATSNSQKSRMTFSAHGNSAVLPIPSVAKQSPEEETKVKEIDPVSQFLDSLGMSQYSQAFSGQQLTELSLVREMCNEDYLQLGVSIGDRIRIQRAISIQ